MQHLKNLKQNARDAVTSQWLEAWAMVQKLGDEPPDDWKAALCDKRLGVTTLLLTGGGSSSGPRSGSISNVRAMALDVEWGIGQSETLREILVHVYVGGLRELEHGVRFDVDGQIGSYRNDCGAQALFDLGLIRKPVGAAMARFVIHEFKKRLFAEKGLKKYIVE